MKRKPKYDEKPLRRPNLEMLQAAEEKDDKILALQQKAASQNILLPTRLNARPTSEKKDGERKESGKGKTPLLRHRISPQG